MACGVFAGFSWLVGALECPRFLGTFPLLSGGNPML